MVVFLFNSVIYVSLLLYLCILIYVYLFLLLYIGVLFHCVVLCLNAYLQLPPGVNPTNISNEQ